MRDTEIMKRIILFSFVAEFYSVAKKAIGRSNMRDTEIMKRIILFSFAFFGVVFCKEDVCVTSKIQQCITVQSMFSQDDNLCKLARTAVGCVQSAIKECQIKEDPNLKEFISILVDICKEGSANNKKFMEHFPCFQNAIDTSMNCVTSIFKPINDETAQDPEKMKEITMDVCRKMDSIVTCFEKKVEEFCTADVKNFFRKIYNPVLKMSKNMCEDL